MAVDLLFYLWLVSVIGGLLYLAVRGERRDLVLHLALSAGMGLTASAAACIALWLLFGGWGPPAPEFFGGLGLVVGIIVGRRSFKRVRRRAESIPTRHGLAFAEVDGQNDGRVGI
jgi:CHASE2 domain-containing sensor protein